MYDSSFVRRLRDVVVVESTEGESGLYDDGFGSTSFRDRDVVRLRERFDMDKENRKERLSDRGGRGKYRD